MARVAAAWEHEVGFGPSKVTVLELTRRKNVLYLRWRQDGAPKHESLRRTARDAKGRLIPEVQQWAVAQAEALSARLRDGTAGITPTAPAKPLTIAEGLAAVVDPRTGRYPVPSAHRREVDLAMQFAISLWGEAKTWESIKKADLIALWRSRIEELRKKRRVGHRAAEITVSRVLTVAGWLRDHELIPATACVAPRRWKDELKSDWRVLTKETADPTPSRPRYSTSEAALLDMNAHLADPRFALLWALGAELRLGQVARCRRRHLTEEPIETPEGPQLRYWLTVESSGKKRGTRSILTPGQVAAWRTAIAPPDGYLHELEQSGEDYPLFPEGQLPGGRSGHPRAVVSRHLDAECIDERTILAWFRKVEAISGIPHLPGRGPYGVRRVRVDDAKKAGISREGLKSHGGWTDTQVPDTIYAEQETIAAAEEAARVRARIRGEQLGPDGEAVRT